MSTPFQPTRKALVAAPATDPLGLGLISTFDPALANTQASVITANRGHGLRVIGGGTISKLGIRVAVSSGNISLAVYRSNGAGRATGTVARVATTGAVACPAAGYAEVSLGGSVTVNPGDWFAISADNTTALFSAAGTNLTQTNLWLGRSFYGNAVHPLPTALNSAGGAALVPGFLIVGVA